MSDQSASTDQNSPSAARGVWEAPSIEELDFSSTETGSGAPGGDGPYTS
jgi:hypothetical protein